MSRTAHWLTHTTPGAPPPPPSRTGSRGYSPAPPTIYPESSVSNPHASRYTGRPSHPTSASHSSYSAHSHTRSHSVGPPPVPHYRADSHTHTHSRSRSHSHSRASSGSHPPSTLRGAGITPVDTYYAPPQHPIIARTSDADGRTDSYMIIPPKGQRVEILHPTLARSATPSPSSSPSSYYAASPSRHSSRPKPLIKQLFGKVEWGGSGASASSASSRSRRNSTGGSGSISSGISSGTGSGAGWTVVSGGSGTRVVTGGGRVVSAGGRGRVVYL